MNETTDLTAEEFEWAWEQSPHPKVVETLEKNQCVIWPWDLRWIYAGPLYAIYEPTTLCPCKKAKNFLWPKGDKLIESGLLEDVLVYLNMKVGLIDDLTGATMRMAVGQCHSCRTVYWQTDNLDAAHAKETKK